MRERWEAIPGLPGYEVSDMGRVRSFRRSGTPGRILKPLRNPWGYLRLDLMKNGARTQQPIHRLVLLVFGGPPQHRGMQCNHINGDKHDNRAENLEWCSRSENTEHACRLGLIKTKLTPTNVLRIRELRKEGHSCVMLARRYGVTPSCIYHVVSGQTWGHV